MFSTIVIPYHLSDDYKEKIQKDLYKDFDKALKECGKDGALKDQFTRIYADLFESFWNKFYRHGQLALKFYSELSKTLIKERRKYLWRSLIFNVDDSKVVATASALSIFSKYKKDYETFAEFEKKQESNAKTNLTISSPK